MIFRQPLCERPPQALLDLFAEKVESMSGHRPDSDLLSRHLVTQRTYICEVNTTPKPAPVIRQTQKIEEQRVLKRSRQSAGFTNTKPISFTFLKQVYPVRTYKEILIRLSNALARIHGDEFSKVLDLIPYFSRDKNDLRDAFRLTGSGIYVETNTNSNQKVGLCFDMIRLMGHTEDDLLIDAQPRPQGVRRQT